MISSNAERGIRNAEFGIELLRLTPGLLLIRTSCGRSPNQGAVFNRPVTPDLFRRTIKGRCPRGVTPLGCSLVLSLREKEQLTKTACFIRAANSRSALCISAAAAQGFRLCGGGQRAFRSPFGILRFPPAGRKRQATTSACFIRTANSRSTLCISAAAAQGFRLCGGGQRAFRSPFGILRFPPAGA